jgi:Leucine-rich repeat (LRR) protein
LIELNLGYNQICDISSLQGLTYLAILHLYNNQISDISSLEGLNLKRLILDCNEISDISPLLGLRLKYLVLNSNPIKNDFAFKNPKTNRWIIYNKKTNLWGCGCEQMKTKDEIIEICKKKDFVEVIEFVKNYK